MNQCDQNVAERPVKHSLLYAFCHLIDLIVYTFLPCKRPFKGTGHPKIVIVTFTHLPFSFFPLLNTKEDILRNVGSQSVDGSH